MRDSIRPAPHGAGLIEVDNKDFKYIYGPVSSWRLGASLGVDLLSSKRKICTFDCSYCQLGKTSRYTNKPKVYVKLKDVIEELKKLPRLKIDYITFSGRGDPTLAKNLGQAIKTVKKLRIAPVAVLTNASLINQVNIRKNLSFADFVIAKLDAHSADSFKRINRPDKSIRFNSVIQGIKNFRQGFEGRFALQIMFIKENQANAGDLAKLTKQINPDEVQINTPTRPCRVKPLSRTDINKIKKYFSGLNFISIYDSEPKKIISLSKKDTLRRRGKVK